MNFKFIKPFYIQTFLGTCLNCHKNKMSVNTISKIKNVILYLSGGDNCMWTEYFDHDAPCNSDEDKELHSEHFRYLQSSYTGALRWVYYTWNKYLPKKNLICQGVRSWRYHCSLSRRRIRNNTGQIKLKNLVYNIFYLT